MNKPIKTISYAFPLLGLLTAPSLASDMDYQALEELFGEPVTMSATGKPQRASEAPVSMVIISGDEFRQSGAVLVPDALQNFAGIDVNRYATMQREVTIRGANIAYNPRLLVLVDGRQVFLDHYGYTDWALLGVEPAEIQQIEIVRGPNSALFGFNASAGVVNVVTKDAFTENSIAGNLQYGSHDTIAGSLVGTLKLNQRFGLKLSGGYEEMDEWDGITVSTKPSYRQNASATLVTKLSDASRISTSYTHATNQLYNQGYAYILLENKSTLQGINNVLSIDSGIGLLKGQISYNWFEQEARSLGRVFYNDVFDAKLENLFKVGANHIFRVAGEFRRNTYQLDVVDAGKTHYEVYAASGMWEWTPTNKITLTNALRVDHMDIGHSAFNSPIALFEQSDYDVTHTELSYNSAVAFRLNDRSSLRVGAARGVQVPSLNSLGVNFESFTPGFAITGDPTLKPSITESYEITYTRSLDAINGQFTLTGASTFVSDFLMASHNLETRLEPGLSFFVEAPLGDFRTHTIETALAGRFNDRLGWEINYTWTGVEEDLNGQELNNQFPLDEGTPANKVNLTFDYKRGAWQAFLAGRFRSETKQQTTDFIPMQPPPQRYLDDTVTLDANMSYNWKSGVRASLYVENLTDNGAYGLSSFDAERRVRIKLSYNH